MTTERNPTTMTLFWLAVAAVVLGTIMCIAGNVAVGGTLLAVGLVLYLVGAHVSAP